MALGSWTFVVCDRGGVPLSQPIATKRTYNPAVSATETASFNVRVGSPLWDIIESYETTLKVYDTFGNLTFYGDVVTDDLDLTQTKEVSVTSVDVSARLAQRLAGKDTDGVGLQYINQDARAIAFDLLSRANAEAATGIVAGSGNIGLSTAPPFTPVAGTFGHTTPGTSLETIYGDQFHGNPTGKLNKQVSKYPLADRATFSSMAMDIRFWGDAAATWMRGVVYADNGGAPGALVDQTSAIQVNLGGGGFLRQFVVFSGLSATVNPGNYWIGYMGGESSEQGAIWFDGGGTKYAVNDTWADGPSANFGGGVASSESLAVYVNYMTAAPLPDPTAFVGPTVTYLWKPLLDAISELGAMADSYEWKLRYVDGTPPTCYLDLVSAVGEDKSGLVFFESGVGLNNCTLFRRTRDARQRITRAYALGTGQTLTAVAFDTAAEAAPYSRAEEVLAVGDITDVTLLDALTAQHVAIRKTPRTVASMTLQPNLAPKYGSWVAGDYVTARGMIEGKLVVDGKARIWGAQISIDEEGNENATPNVEPTT